MLSNTLSSLFIGNKRNSILTKKILAKIYSSVVYGMALQKQNNDNNIESNYCPLR